MFAELNSDQKQAIRDAKDMRLESGKTLGEEIKELYATAYKFSSQPGDEQAAQERLDKLMENINQVLIGKKLPVIDRMIMQDHYGYQCSERIISGEIGDKENIISADLKSLNEILDVGPDKASLPSLFKFLDKKTIEKLDIDVKSLGTDSFRDGNYKLSSEQLKTVQKIGKEVKAFKEKSLLPEFTFSELEMAKGLDKNSKSLSDLEAGCLYLGARLAKETKIDSSNHSISQLGDLPKSHQHDEIDRAILIARHLLGDSSPKLSSTDTVSKPPLFKF